MTFEEILPALKAGKKIRINEHIIQLAYPDRPRYAYIALYDRSGKARDLWQSILITMLFYDKYEVIDD